MTAQKGEILNTLDPNDYYSQNNNELRPRSACNVTSMIMAACQAGHFGLVARAVERTGLRYKQPEDSLMAWLNSERWREHAATNYGESYRNRPQEVWATLVAGFNDWVGEQLASIDWNVSIDDICVYVDNGSGLVCGGDFTPEGHFVNVGGYRMGTSGPDAIVCNDPAGTYLDGYRGLNGYGQVIPSDLVTRIVRGRKNRAGEKLFFVIVVEP